MFLVKYRYKSGVEGFCEEFGKTISFETESEAAEYAKNLNESIDDNLKGFFPEWFPFEVKDERNDADGRMKVLELFAGTRSIGKAFESKGHEVFSVEWDKDFENINLYEDIKNVTAEDIIQLFGKPDVIWASPDCSTFSVAAISKHRRKNKETGSLEPISEYAKFCDEVDKHVLKLIEELNPQFWFIENPRGGMRKMSWMQGLPRYTVTYCQYGERRMKPTDIWTNHPHPQFKSPCKNGDSCHDAAPRGSQTGTQALKNAKEKGIIPEALCQHIVDICEKYID